jgi:hypothetical protein
MLRWIKVQGQAIIPDPVPLVLLFHQFHAAVLGTALL